MQCSYRRSFSFLALLEGLRRTGLLACSSAPSYWLTYSQQVTSMRRNTKWEGCVVQKSARLHEEDQLGAIGQGKANRINVCYTGTKLATFDQALAAICRVFAHSEHHRCPQLTHTNCSTVSPVTTSIAVSTRSVPSHILHRTNSVSIEQSIC